MISISEDIADKEVKVGDTIVASKYAGYDVTCEGQKYKVVKYIDVLAIIEK